MANDQDRITKLTDSALRMGALAACMEKFVMQIISHGRRRRLTYETLSAIRVDCIRDAKNVGVAGLPIEREAEMLRQLIEDFDKMMERTIAKGWHSKNP